MEVKVKLTLQVKLRPTCADADEVQAEDDVDEHPLWSKTAKPFDFSK